MKRVFSILIVIALLVSSFISFPDIETAHANNTEQLIYLKNNFDDKYYGANDPFNNVQALADGNNITTDVSSDGNRYMVYEKYAPDYPYPTETTGNLNFRKIFSRVNIWEESKIVFHFKLKPKSVTDNSHFYVKLVDRNNATAIFSVYGNKIDGKEVLSQDSWTTIDAAYDFNDRTMNVYADGINVYSKSGINTINTWQLSIQAENGYPACTYLFDDFLVYGGEVVFEEEKLATLNYASILNADKNSPPEGINAISVYGDYFIASSRGNLNNLAKHKDGVLYLNTQAFASLIGGSSSESVFEPCLDVLDMYSLNGVYDGKGFVYWSDSGVDLNLTDAQSWSIYNKLVYDRPDRNYLKANAKKTHPRLSIEDGAIEKIKNDILNNEYSKKYYELAQGYVIPYLKEEPRDTAALDTTVMMKARSVTARVQSLSLMYLITKEDKYKNKVWDELLVATSDAYYPHWQPNSGLDNAEMAAAIAYGYDWLYDYWNDDQKKILEKAIYEKALIYADMNYGGQVSSDDTWWANSKNSNHNAVDNGGYILAALSVIDVYPELASRVLERAIRSLESFQNSFYPGGGWVEGVTYWVYSMIYWTPAVRSLQISYGTDFNLSHTPGMEESAEFIVHACGLGANNFHDSGSEEIIYQIGSFYKLAEIFDRPDFADIKLTYDMRMPARRDLSVLLDFYPEKTKLLSGIPLPKDTKYDRIGFVSMRENWLDDNSMFVSFHGGDALPNHGHYDTGSFIYEYGGQRFAIDLPAEDYSFSDRSLVYRGRAEGHNCLVINPDASSGHIKTAFSPVESFETNNYGAYAILNMTPAYSSYAKSVKRGIKTEDNRNSAIIRDEIENLSQDSSIYWFMHVDAATDVVINSDSLVLTKKGVSIKLEADTNLENELICLSSAEPMSTSPNPAGQSDNSAYKKIVIKGTASAGSDTYIQVKLSPVSDDIAPMEIKSFADWSNPELCEINYKTQNDKKYADIEISEKGRYAFVAIYNDGELVSLIPATDNSYDGMSLSSAVMSGEKIETCLFVWESEETLRPVISKIPLK